MEKTVCEIFCCNKHGDIRYHVNGEQFEGTLVSGLEYYRKYLRDEYDHEKKLKLIDDNIENKKLSIMIPNGGLNYD